MFLALVRGRPSFERDFPPLLILHEKRGIFTLLAPPFGSLMLVFAVVPKFAVSVAAEVIETNPFLPIFSVWQVSLSGKGGRETRFSFSDSPFHFLS